VSQKKRHPFEAFSRNYHERHAGHRESQFEETRVDYLLKALNLGKVAGALWRRSKQETGHATLSFEQFNQEFPSSPLLLGASTLDGAKLHTDARVMLPALFKRFDAAPFVTAFEEFYEREEGRAQGRTLGLVFPRKGLRQGLIIHGEGLEAVFCHGLSLVYVGGTRRRPHSLYVRPFQALVEAVYNKGHGWRPD
jgi:hypothetical protein